jgi:DNA polymerase-3 subunit gamma/tau
VLSRCLQFHLRRLPLAQIEERLAAISKAEGIEYEPAALKAIARSAEGSMRDALSLLDQVLAFGGGRAIESEVRALLGTLDRRHVESILDALSAGDGGALMTCVAQLDERAPDYDQALGELASALQRMALLQALPGLESEDEEQDATLARLSNKFSPEDLQLLYQIAITARRDLDFAPDARGGFEMTLLRMLAFRPSPPTGLAALEPARQSHELALKTNELALRSSEPASRSNRAVPAAPAAAANEPSTPVAVTGDEWGGLVSSLGLPGPVGALASHCALVGRGNGVVRLRLDASGEVYRRPQFEQQLAEALSRHFGEPVRLEIAAGPGNDVTPARQQARAAQERQEAAERAIESDANVRAMREIFGATVQPGSVKPLK